MKTHRVLAILFAAIVSTSAFAQASRTWVSGVGDDVNPCSRTAPCKTFAGAISKTQAGGEISVLDPGGFGALTITKAITIEGADFVSSVLVAGTNGIVIQAGTADVVHLRSLRFNGLGGANGGLFGIRILSAGQVTIEDCTIFSFMSGGIDIATSNSIRVAVSDTSIRNVTGWGIHSVPTAAPVRLTLDHVRVTGTLTNGLTGSGSGLFADGGTVADAVDSVFSNNLGAGLFVRNGSDVNVHGSAIFGNITGVSVGDAGGGTVRLFGSSVVTNATGISIVSGQVLSHGNNAIVDNSSGNTTSGNISTQ